MRKNEKIWIFRNWLYCERCCVPLRTDKHKEVINSYAENGYRYVGFIPTEIDAKGCMRKIDLIFEKED